MEGRAFKTVFFDPLRGAGKDILTIVVEAQNKRPAYLNSVIVQETDTAGVVLRFRGLLSGIGEIVLGQALEAYEDSSSGSRCPLGDYSRIVGDIGRQARAPRLRGRPRG